MATPATSSLGSLLALTGALAGAGAGAGQGAEPHQRLDPDYLDQYRRAFDEFDLDGDGKISTQVRRLLIITVLNKKYKRIFCRFYTHSLHIFPSHTPLSPKTQG